MIPQTFWVWKPPIVAQLEFKDAAILHFESFRYQTRLEVSAGKYFYLGRRHLMVQQEAAKDMKNGILTMIKSSIVRYWHLIGALISTYDSAFLISRSYKGPVD